MFAPGFEAAIYVSLGALGIISGAFAIYNLHASDVSLGKHLSVATLLVGAGFAFFYSHYLGLIGGTAHQFGSSLFLLAGQALILYVVYTIHRRVAA